MRVALGDLRPELADDAFAAPTATLIGDVHLGPASSVWYGAVLRADFAAIVLGLGSNVQDNCVLHTAEDQPTLLAAGVTVGHGAVLEGCSVEDGALIGMRAVVLNRAVVGAGSMVAAGSVVREDTVIPPGVLVAGVPAVVKGPLAPAFAERAAHAAAEYQRLAARYKAQARHAPAANR